MSKALRGLAVLALASALAACLPLPARAGAVDPSHRFESLRIEVPDAAEILERPGSNRLVVFLRDGSIRAVVGGHLAGETLGVIPATTSCATGGVLAAAWEPANPGRVAFVTYIAVRNSALAVGRIDLSDGAFTEIWNHAVAAPCTNPGGGIAILNDGTLLVGIGDMGQPSRAGSGTSNLGKLYRMTATGGFPAAPLDLNPLGAASYMYATGVRNPVTITVDRPTGEAWFLDQGPGDEDELNLAVSAGNYGWAASQQMGPLQTAGLEDPFHTFGANAGASALAIERGGRLGSAHLGAAIAGTAGTGEIVSIRVNRLDRLNSTATPLFTRDATGPQAFVSLYSTGGGDLHVLDGAGGAHRLLAAGGIPREPSAIGSVVPLTARKLVTGDIEIASERVPGVAESGLAVGTLATLASAGYSHAAVAPTYQPVTDLQGDAWTRMTVAPDSLVGAGQSAYFLVSARRDCLESGLGQGSDGAPRPQFDGGCSVDVLGGGTHDIADVEVTVLADSTDGLGLPRDLAFHPDMPGELWVVNNSSNSGVVIHDAGLPSQWITMHMGPGGDHFFSRPAALAFGPGTGFFATIQEEDDYTQGPPPGGTPQDFMGPTLWTSDSNEFEGGHASHYDMLHNSPNGVGIAWETGNAYWIYDGYHLSLTRYDFAADHGPGGSDHTDGVIRRYVEGEVGYAPEISSNVQFDPASGLVYAADTANARIVVLDPRTGSDGGAISPNYDGCSQRAVVGASLTTFIDGATYGLVAPSGLELWDNLMFVSDNATSRIFAFNMAGELVDYLDTGFPPGTLMGMSFDPRDGSLCVVDVPQMRVLRLRPR